jgi:hypothetical protein
MGNQPFANDVVSKIEGSASFLNVDVLNVDTSTPDLTTVLDLYSAVMVIGGNNPFQDANLLGTNLQKYIDQGHGVVITAAANTVMNCTNPNVNQLCGTFQSGDYWALEPGTTSYNVHATLGTVYIANSPLLNGVTTFDGGSLSEKVLANVNSNVNTTRVADWSNGTPLLVTRTFASGATEVALNMYPPSNDQNGVLWLTSTDGGKLLANAMTVAAGGFQGTGTDPAPEPSTYLVTGAGLALVGVLLRRRTTLQCESAQRPRKS